MNEHKLEDGDTIRDAVFKDGRMISGTIEKRPSPVDHLAEINRKLDLIIKHMGISPINQSTER